MSQGHGPAASPSQRGPERWERLPSWLRPSEIELPGSGELRLVETIVLVLIGLLLGVATANDVARQRDVNVRLIADLRTWRTDTGHDFHNLSIDQQLLGGGRSSSSTDREVVCGNTAPGRPKATSQLCLVIAGSVVDGRRTVQGGWYLPAHTEDDVRGARYGCFGPAGRGSCAR